ncbi:hypothetical protein L486_00560 [Kwoniella mangroviensis CBS 10435]|uniref:Uncharacterized protein n=1 Tax=Kwoniella mangroviensis CBS 10435 TaxID=1331196 RepID=A0A1B9IZG2_9TREE|nr:uncharacterized protein I203_04094 [Kwoniella mangroviensis CBS 8507]OCF60916.1 hypothetical protein L486_00560 [Kwoniella mangroviensis CBS 10435]OCF66518.1 hypothetical protein I203_04094 [Kwoniella mangroviensis CBS 8507]
MFTYSLLAILPILGLASASVVPRAFTGTIHPASNSKLCIAASSATTGASVGFEACGSNPSLETFNVTSSSTWDRVEIALKSDLSLCLDGGNRAQSGGVLTLGTCGANSDGQLISKSTDGFLSFQNAYCFHKKSDSELDIQTCWTMDDPLKFTVS